MDRRKILYILLVFFGLSLFYRMATIPEEKRAPLKYKTGTEAVVKKETPDKLVPASSKPGARIQNKYTGFRIKCGMTK